MESRWRCETWAEQTLGSQSRITLLCQLLVNSKWRWRNDGAVAAGRDGRGLLRHWTSLLTAARRHELKGQTLQTLQTTLPGSAGRHSLTVAEIGWELRFAFAQVGPLMIRGRRRTDIAATFVAVLIAICLSLLHCQISITLLFRYTSGTALLETLPTPYIWGVTG